MPSDGAVVGNSLTDILILTQTLRNHEKLFIKTLTLIDNKHQTSQPILIIWAVQTAYLYLADCNPLISPFPSYEAETIMAAKPVEKVKYPI